MIAKLIVWGKDRKEALERMNRALREFAIDGVHTTIPFHLKVINHPKFVSGDFHIQFLETINLDEESPNEHE
jgi:acetyl-CoA carboxylase biotin carboxylase subunit